MDELIDFVGDISVYETIFVFILFFAFSIKILKNKLYGPLDPLWIVIFFNSFSFTIITFLSLSAKNLSYIFDLITVNILIFTPTILSKKITLNYKQKKITLYKIATDNNIAFFMYTLCITCVTISLIFWIIVGVPLFGSDISNSKVEYYEGGFGQLRYLQMLMPPVCSLYGAIRIFYRKTNLMKKKFEMLIFVILPLFISLSGGSKSAMLYIITTLGIFIYLTDNADIKRKVMYIALISFLLTVTLSVVILLNSSDDIFSAIKIRLLASGDVYYFWYNFNVSNNYLDIRPIAFLTYLISPITSALRLTTYEYPLGAIVMNDAVNFPLSSFGPNAQLPIVAKIYFNYISYIMLLFFGYVFLWIRKLQFKILIKANTTAFYFSIILYNFICIAIVDLNHFVAIIFSSFFWFLIVFSISTLLHNLSSKLYLK